MSALLGKLCLRGLSAAPPRTGLQRCRSFAVSAAAAPRVYTYFSIYKGKSALEVKPLAATLEASGVAGCVAPSLAPLSPDHTSPASRL